MRKVVLLLLFFLINKNSCAQTLIHNQEIIKVEDGLPQSFVSGILQDKNGFIWVATSDGLARYDGHRFKVLSKAATEQIGFRSSVFEKIQLSSNNHFILVNQGGIVADFDPDNFKVKNAKITIPIQLQGVLLPSFDKKSDSREEVNFFYIDGVGKGINYINLSTGQNQFLGVSNGKLRNDTICAVTRDSSGSLFILSPAGLQISKNGGESFQWVPYRIPEKAINGNFRDVLQLPDQSFVKIVDDQLFFIDPVKKFSRTMTLPAGNKSVERWENIMGVDYAGRPYFEFQGNIYRVENGALKSLWTNVVDPSLRITACFIDKSDVLWTSVNALGLIKVNLRTAPFYSYKYAIGFFADIYQRLGITKSALPQSWFNNKAAAYFYYNVYGKDANLYLSHSSVKMEPVDISYWNGKNLIPLKFPLVNEVSLRGIATNQKGEVWVADAGNLGLWHWQNKESNPQFVLFDTTKDYTINGTEIGNINLIDNQLWITTYGKGLFLFENGKMVKEFRRKYDANVLPNNLTDVCADPANNEQLWIGSRGEGLILFNKKEGLRKIFTTADGLPNNTIYCIVADRSGMLWLSTNNGICRFDPRKFTSTSYVKTDGLAGNEFNRNHKFVFPDGRIAFGGLDGYSIFNPDEFEIGKSNLPVSIQITHLYINNVQQDFIDSSSLIRVPFSQLKELRLPYNKNNISIEFAALQFNNPREIRYRYMLKNVDMTWRESGFNSEVSYSQLRAGNYTLLMNATSLTGEWSDSVLELRIIIEPPFWKTWWAYLIYILSGIALLRVYLLAHNRRLREQQQLLFEHKEAVRLKELDEMKDRFFSNVTHEFRTPLTLIITPLEQMIKDQSLSAKTSSGLRSIAQNASHLLTLINEFLDFSKLQNNRIKVNLSNGDLALFINDQLQQFMPATVQNGIHFSYKYEGAEGLYLFDKNKWKKIVINLVSNALKFTPADGTISVILSKTEIGFQLEVSDTGIGIPEDQLQKVFERFYRVDYEKEYYGGTGIGLSLVKELVQLMSGTIEVRSIVGRGSAFTVMIPVSSSLTLNNINQLNKWTEEEIHNDPVIPAKIPADSNQEKPLIMVVEDNTELRQFMAESLPGTWNIVTAFDGEEAWKMILSEMPDVIISDVMMPGIDGFELCKLSKNDIRTAHISFVLLTSRAAHDLKMEGLQAGADDYITKPFHLEELELRINNMLQIRQKQREFLQSQLLQPSPGQDVPKVEDVFLKEFYKILDDNLEDAEMGVEFMAAQMAMSRSSLNRKLKNLSDTSTNEIIKSYRLQKAATLLKAGNDITGTGYKTGFSSPSYFAHCFKEHYGITPSDYVDSLKQGK